MKKRRRLNKSEIVSRYRGFIGAIAVFLSNIHIFNFKKGTLYQGNVKSVCVPGLNCYSCPAATASCPIGAFQAVVGSSGFRFSYYITGILILFGTLFGRIICGLLCPFGWFQELLYKIPSKKLETKKVSFLTYIKYVVLALFVVLLPIALKDDVGLSIPYFCKYICPAGILEGAIPLSIANSAIRSALGILFSWKLIVLLSVVLLSILVYRPFCKWICPLGAFYSLFNKIALIKLSVDKNKCISCGKCKSACKMDVDVTENANNRECIRCTKCIKACPVSAISFKAFEKNKRSNNEK